MINSNNISTKQIHFLLGSNIGDRQNMLSKAIAHLMSHYEIASKSSIYESEAWGNENQAKFLNQAVIANTNFSAIAALSNIKTIETTLGRRSSNKWFPRCMDIDIIFYGDDIIDSPTLTIPHKYFHQRKFALLPFEEIMPNFIHPVFNKSITQLLSECNDPLKVKKLTQ